MKLLEDSVAFTIAVGVMTAATSWGCSSSGADTPGGASDSGSAGMSASGASGASSGGASSATAGTLSVNAGTAGTASGGGTTSASGAPSGDGGGTPSPTQGCSVGTWPAADPTKTGPYETVTENEVGPEAGEADEESGAVPKFTLFRPKELSPDGRCHPVITWGNGTGSTPNAYRSLLSLFASHGFVVIASNSKNVSRGDPKPMLVGGDLGAGAERRSI